MFPRLLSILAIIILTAAPIVTPSAAGMMAGESMAGMEQMAAMPDGLPCCPDQKQSVPDCQKSCPLATLCAAKCFANVVAADQLARVRVSATASIAPGNDFGRDLLAEPPPPRPPRS
ncbi:hypothetical protein [Mesorhizobium sp. M7A.F.Ca.US.008.03.1.1]|uniref:hypothetical protein n=1 Tax=Mesorhizobium sp. M7A.F.Ca.US.008.03.1.1 TaxID=2496742 RepID=UPI001FE029A2|nr:hypothetical protein [Mesorhizobium sp. M7A.F.Ca.US.008.03.1.1]